MFFKLSMALPAFPIPQEGQEPGGACAGVRMFSSRSLPSLSLEIQAQGRYYHGTERPVDPRTGFRSLPRKLSVSDLKDQGQRKLLAHLQITKM